MMMVMTTMIMTMWPSLLQLSVNCRKPPWHTVPNILRTCLAAQGQNITRILIVAVAKTHNFEKNQCRMPCYKQFTVLMLLFEETPYFILPFSTTNMNLHLGKMIRNMDYRQSKTLHQYVINNENLKLVPIQQGRTGSSPQRQFHLKEYYTTAKSVASMH